MYATTANSVWPAKWPATVQAVAYAQVGDFFKMFVQHRESDFVACEFCRTMNSLDAVRCATCGGSLTPPSDEAPSPDPVKPARNSFSDARALRSVLTMVLIPPLLLFIGFAAWHQLQFENHEPAATLARAVPSSAASANPIAVVSPQQKIVADLLASRNTTVGPEPVRGVALPATPPEVQAQAPEQEASDRASIVWVPVPPTRAAKSAPGRTKEAAVASARHGQNFLAECSTRSFLARAVCINNRCAEPGAARLGQCREAVRQRRIDEARRNPMLMG
jgi:hypothetical protein